MFVIEKGMPRPMIKGKRKATPIYPFSAMSVNDSFFIPCPDADQETMRKTRSKARDAGKQWRYRNKQWDVAFDTVIVDGGVRIWRIA